MKTTDVYNLKFLTFDQEFLKVYVWKLLALMNLKLMYEYIHEFEITVIIGAIPS